MDFMRVLVTGSAGQLGHDVVNELNKRGIFVVGTDIYQESELTNKATWNEYVPLDITDRVFTEETIKKIQPSVIIHCAAWTNVDGAENDFNKPLVKRINVDGTDVLVKTAKSIKAKFLYISTDYVFDGSGTNPWKPDDNNYAPLNFYGETNLLGEMAVASQLVEFFIVRIAWVFGLNGNNFIKTMLTLAERGYKELRVVDDQIGTPTYTLDLARLRIKVKRVSTTEYGISVAKRPYNSRLQKNKLIENGFAPLPSWKDALRRYLKQIEAFKGDN